MKFPQKHIYNGSMCIYDYTVILHTHTHAHTCTHTHTHTHTHTCTHPHPHPHSHPHSHPHHTHPHSHTLLRNDNKCNNFLSYSFMYYITNCTEVLIIYKLFLTTKNFLFCKLFV